jgi:hypothetical protein
MAKQNSTAFKKSFISKHLGKHTNWPREMKIMNQLSSKYTDESFWLGLELKFKIPSLAWFITSNGDKFLREEWAKYKFKPEKVKKFEIEEDIEKEIKPAILDKESKKEKLKSLNDFLRIWKK